MINGAKSYLASEIDESYPLPHRKPKKSIVNSNVKFHLSYCLPFLFEISVVIFLDFITENHERKDKMSILPQDLIGLILERIPVQDAVRTSVLSKGWRYRWTTMTVLVFDEQFSKKYEKNRAFGDNGLIRIINHVLILHNGPISKFYLYIPRRHLDSFQEVHQMMLLVSRKSVVELTLTNSNGCYELPSCISSCSKLKKLQLENFIIKPLLKFDVFFNLEDLRLRNIDFGANSCGSLITLPQLRRLLLETCTNVHNFNIKADNLHTLAVDSCPDAMFLRLLDAPCLNTVGICFPKPLKDFVPVERMNLTMLLSNLPEVEVLIVDGYFLKYLSADEIPKWLPCAVDTLIHLHFIDVDFSDLDQLHGALCLLRNSPNLETLWMVHPPIVMDYDVGPASNLLETADCLDQTLNELYDVEIESFEGSRPNLLFIKLLLAHTPSLEELTIKPCGTCYAHQRLDEIAMDVSRFPRASPEAEVIFLNPKP
ncbi:hypothetical protein OSB04_013432 [Centaurea solstitialis]|uniref:F-box domain-containing protein n=1 Tax=Centaurea solstitialis TaxID=347529 RepID=A0AA38TY01_9ASTR|nr:hypothetical protein OSB04_013432 [Centaurea solstitialis]